ncbi:MAG: hypothetical protein M3151_01295 [Actinomycetota bacterium]|nr:hypothetical protein [Actinomycetota bacterium]
MKISVLGRWVGPSAIAGGVLMVFSDLLNLTIYVPGLGEAAHTGYQAVGLGVILFAMTLLLVGMVGLYARSAPAGGARVIEYGDARARYVLTELEEPILAETTGIRRRAGSEGLVRARGVAAHRTAHLIRKA